MLKFESCMETFTEVPTELALCYNITRCPCHCEGCFEPWLADDYGARLTFTQVLNQYKASMVTAVCFLGGDGDIEELTALCKRLKEEVPHIKLCFYSGRPYMYAPIEPYLDYYKVGPYIPTRGPLDQPTTNQRFFVKNDAGEWEDRTAALFQKSKKE